MVARDLHGILYRLHDQRGKLAPSFELRRAHLTAAFNSQIRAERESLEGRIGRLQPGVRRVYLQNRLALLDARAGMKPVGLRSILHRSRKDDIGIDRRGLSRGAHQQVCD